VLGSPERESSDEFPWLLIDVPAGEVWDGIRGGVHHWDQNGVFALELDGMGEKGRKVPKAIREVQGEVVRFVGVWLRWWKEEKGLEMGGLRKQAVEDL